MLVGTGAALAHDLKGSKAELPEAEGAEEGRVAEEKGAAEGALAGTPHKLLINRPGAAENVPMFQEGTEEGACWVWGAPGGT